MLNTLFRIGFILIFVGIYAGCTQEMKIPVSSQPSSTLVKGDISEHWHLNAVEKAQVYGKWSPDSEIYLMTSGAYYFFGDHTFVSSLVQSQFAEELANIACIGQWRLREDKVIEIKIISVLVGHPVDESQLNDVVDNVHTGYKSFSIQKIDNDWKIVGEVSTAGTLKMIYISSSGKNPYGEVINEKNSIDFSRYTVDQKLTDVLNAFPSILADNDYDRFMKLFEICGGVL